MEMTLLRPRTGAAHLSSRFSANSGTLSLGAPAIDALSPLPDVRVTVGRFRRRRRCDRRRISTFSLVANPPPPLHSVPLGPAFQTLPTVSSTLRFKESESLFPSLPFDASPRVRPERDVDSLDARRPKNKMTSRERLSPVPSSSVFRQVARGSAALYSRRHLLSFATSIFFAAAVAILSGVVVSGANPSNSVLDPPSSIRATRVSNNEPLATDENDDFQDEDDADDVYGDAYDDTYVYDIPFADEGLADPEATASRSLAEEERRRYDFCPECERRRRLEAKLTESEIRKARIEMIKNRILSNLRLPHRPNITRSRATIPSQLLKVLEFGEYARRKRPRNDEDGPKTTQVYIFGEGLAEPCYQYQSTVGPHATCFYLPFKDELFGKRIKSAELFVFQKRESAQRKPQLSVLRGHVTGENGHHHHHRRGRTSLHKTLANQPQTIKNSGWIKFDLKRAFKRLNDRYNVNVSLVINCTNCDGDVLPFPVGSAEGERPFLKLHTVDSGGRQKRSLECTKNTQACCREKFYISFAEIGWDDWIIAPNGYWANYCTGSCAGLTEPIFHHSSLLLKAKSLEINSRLRQSLAPCCTPKKMAPASLLYRADGEKIFQQNLHNMVVEECGCA